MCQKIVTAMMASLVALVTNGCANMTTTEQRTLSGAAIGAAGGAAIAAIAEGSVATGIASGAGAGAAAGVLYSLGRNEQHAAYRPTAKSQPAKAQLAKSQSARAAKASKPATPARAPAEELLASD